MSIRKTRVIVGIAFALAALIITWLLTEETSPLYNYFLFHVGLKNIWAFLNFIPFMAVLILTRGNFLPELLVSELAISLQWFLIGYLASVFFWRVASEQEPEV